MSATIFGAITFKGKNSVASPSGDTSTSRIPVPLLSLLLREIELKYKGSKLRYDSSRDKLTDSGGLLSLTVLSENCKVVLKRREGKVIMYILSLKKVHAITSATVNLGPAQTPNFYEPNLIQIKANPDYLDRKNCFRRRSYYSSRTKLIRRKMLISVKLLTKYVIIIYALGSVQEKFGVWIKAVQSRSKVEIPDRAGWEEWLRRSKLKQAFLIDSDAELFMNLIQCIMFGF